MITTPPEFRALLEELSSASWTLAAIGTMFDSGLADQLREPRTVDELVAACPSLSRERISRILAVAASRDVVAEKGDRYQLAPGAAAWLAPPMRPVIIGDLRSSLLQPVTYYQASTRGGTRPGWHHTDPVILQAQGDASSGFAMPFKMHMLNELGDLAARLDRPGAKFLDIGVGVAALSIAMCRAFPQLAAVGLDASDVPLALARDNVARVSLGDRIELRQLAAQALRDEGAFELAWVPTCFIEPTDVDASLARVHASLRDGGWILIPSMKPAMDPKAMAVTSMIIESWGGPVLDAPATEAQLARAGFSKIRTLPGPTWTALVVAQK